MERITGWLLTCALLLTGLTAFAVPDQTTYTDNEELRFKSEAIADRVIKVLLVNLQKETTVVKLADMEGKEYYRRTIKNHNGFARKLDLDKLRNGRYLLTVEQNDQKWVQVVLVDSYSVRLSNVVEKG